MIVNHNNYSYYRKCFVEYNCKRKTPLLREFLLKGHIKWNQNKVWLFQAVSSSDKRIKGFVHVGTVDYKAKFTLMTDKCDKVFGEDEARSE